MDTSDVLREMVDITDFVQDTHRTALKIVIRYDGQIVSGVGFSNFGGEYGKRLALEIAIADQATQIRRYQEQRAARARREARFDAWWKAWEPDGLPMECVSNA